MIPALLTTALCVVVSLPLTRRFGRAAGWPLAVFYLIATAALLPTAAEVLAGGQPVWSHPWMGSLGVNLALRADGLGLVFAFIALVIGAVVFGYSARYLGPGRHLSFYLVMTLFTLSMLGLVLADDLILLFLCWELTSMASFLLIARSGRPGEHASMRTLLMTYLGGLALLVATGLVVARTGTTSLSATLTSPLWDQDPGFAATVGCLVALAGFSKAAQFPFHVWLPDAMAAPTPVSAYLHAAAVVKAGIFLLLRFTPAFHATPLWNTLLLVVGLFTAILGARFALEQTDLKRLMAYSTVSQLGLIVATIGIGTQAAVAAAVLHTIAHALFKSGLFMMVGVVDHAAHTRDMRRLPPLWREMPWAFAVTVLGCASMAGIPPSLGFVSKESLFTGLLGASGPPWAGWAALVAATVASVMTFGYCAKIVLGGFVDGRDTRSLQPAEIPLVTMAGLPVVAGLPLGMAAGVFDLPVARAVEAGLPGAEAHPHFSLWHGLTPELIATLTVFGLGALLAWHRRRLWPTLERPSLWFDGPGAITAVRDGLRRAGLALDGLTAVDHPSRHLAAIAGTFAVLVFAGGAAVMSTGDPPAGQPGATRAIDVVLLVLVAAAVTAVCRSKSRLAATVSLSGVGILATVQLLALGAPDVGLTQLLVESLTIIVIMLVLQRLPLRFGRPPLRHRVSTGAVALGAGLAAGLATWLLAGRRERSEVAEYYLNSATDVTGGANIVNVILVEFRALDTLGELAVLGMAGIALLAVLSTVRHSHLDPHPEHEPPPTPALRAAGSPAHRAITQAWPNAVALQLMLRFVAPILAVLSAVIFLRGHNSPGGGFIAALVGATIVGLLYLSTSCDRQIGPPRLPVAVIGGGVLCALGTGVWGLVARGSFLEPLYGDILGMHLASSMLFDVGVYAAVLGLIMLAFNLLGVSETPNTDAQVEETRERADEAYQGELPGPLETTGAEGRGVRVGLGTRHVATGTPPKEPGR